MIKRGRLIAVIILSITVFFSVMGILSSAEEYSGKLGTHTYIFDSETGRLTVSGTGVLKGAIADKADMEIKEVVIEEGTTSIGASFFEGWSELERVELPTSVTKIGAKTFKNCTSLIFVDLPNVTVLPTEAFSGCKKLTSIGSSIKIEKIETAAFYGCTSLKSLELPKVKNIFGYAFSYCSGLEEFSMPNVQSIGVDAFTGCTKLIKSKKGVNFVGDWVVGCSNDITELIIPDGARGIAGRAFAKRKNIVSATIPDSVEDRIGTECFYGCTSLETLTMPMCFDMCVIEDGDSYGTYYSFFHIGMFFGYNSAFDDSICIPEAFHKIVYTDTWNWYSPTITGNYYYVPKSLKKIYITSGNMPDYRNLYGPSGDIWASDWVQETYGDSLNIDLIRVALDWKFDEKSGTLTITGGGMMPDYEVEDAPWAEYSGKIKKVEIRGIESIGANAFYGCYALEEISFEQRITKISQAAFYYCVKLKNIDFTGVKTIGRYAFSNCKALKAVDLSGVETVDVSAFESCTALESIIFPGGGGYIGQYAFSGCTALGDLYLYECSYTLGSGVFRNCFSIKNIFIFVSVPDSWDKNWTAGFDGKVHYSSIWHTSGNRHCHKCSDSSCIIEEAHIFDEEGVACEKCGYYRSGFVQVENGYVYYENGAVKTGWFYVGNALVYADPYSKLAVCYNSYIGGKFYVWNDDTGLGLANGFVSDQKGTKCYQNGVQVIGWRHEDGSGPKIVNGVYEQYSETPENLYYFLSTTGYMVTDQTYKLGGYNREFNADHTVKPVDGPQTIAGEFYYYKNGVKQTGWHRIGDLTYYFRASDSVYGRAATKWIYIGNRIYYFYASTSATPYAHKDSGKIGGIEYTYHEDGYILYNGFVNCEYANAMNNNTVANIQKKNGTTRYYINGEMQTGWHEINGYWYYFYAMGSANGSGYMCVTSRYIGGVWYEFTEDGRRIDGGLRYVLNEDGASYMVSGMGELSSALVVIPESYKDKPITAIGERAFYENEEICEIVIPQSVETIGNHAFYNCTNLTSADIGNGVKVIGEYSFGNCRELGQITIGKSLKSVGKYAFSECNNLKDVYIYDVSAWCGIDFKGSYALANNPLYNGENLYLNGEKVRDLIIPHGVETIKPFAFFGCKSIESVTIPNSVSLVDNAAFRGCSSLSEIVFLEGEDQVELVIDDDAFRGCSSVRELILPDRLTEIGLWAFQSCGMLNYVKMSENIKNIGRYAFQNCRELTTMIIPKSTEMVESGVFQSCTSLVAIYCEKESIPYKWERRKEDAWHSWLSGCNAKVYLSDRWYYVDGVPTLK